jgi:hypothetical protein
MPSPGSSSSEPFYREVSADALLQQQQQLLLLQQQQPHQPLAGPSTSLLQSVAGPGSANGSEDTRDKDGKLKRTREGCYTCRNRKCVVVGLPSEMKALRSGRPVPYD